jgi:hypothetical protein
VLPLCSKQLEESFQKFLKNFKKDKIYSNLPNLATFKIEILAHGVKIPYDQILFLESLILDEVKNKMWSYGSSTL